MSNYTQYPFCQDYNRIGINDETIIQYQTELNCKILINYIVEGRSHEKKINFSISSKNWMEGSRNLYKLYFNKLNTRGLT